MVAEERSGRRIDFLREQPERAGSRAEGVVQLQRLIQPALLGEIIHESEAAEQKRALVPGEAVRRFDRQGAVEQALPGP